MLPLTEKPSLYFDKEGYQKIVSEVPKIPGALQMKNWGKFVVFLIDSYFAKPQPQNSDNSAQIFDYQKTIATLQQQVKDLSENDKSKEHEQTIKSLVAQIEALTERAQHSETENSDTIISEIEEAHREVINKLNASHDKKVGELNRHIEIAESKVQELMEENTTLQTEAEKLQEEILIVRNVKPRIVDLSQRYLTRSAFSDELNKLLP